MTSTMMIAAVLALFGIIGLIARSGRREEAERAEGYKKQASLRGWHLDIRPHELHYSGTTEGIPWTYTAIRHLRTGENRHPSIWQTTAARSENVRIVWPKGAEPPPTYADVPAFARKLAFLPLAGMLGVSAEDLANAQPMPELQEELDDTRIAMVLLSPNGLKVVVPTVEAAPHTVEKIAKLGARLAKATPTSP